MDLARLLAYAETRPGMVVSTRVRRVGDTVEGLCIAGFYDGARPAMRVVCPAGTPLADALDQAAANALSYWLTIARCNQQPAWTPPAPVVPGMTVLPVRTMVELFDETKRLPSDA